MGAVASLSSACSDDEAASDASVSDVGHAGDAGTGEDSSIAGEVGLSDVGSEDLGVDDVGSSIDAGTGVVEVEAQSAELGAACDDICAARSSNCVPDYLWEGALVGGGYVEYGDGNCFEATTCDETPASESDCIVGPGTFALSGQQCACE